MVDWARTRDVLLLVELKTSPAHDLETAPVLAELFGAADHPGDRPSCAVRAHQAYGRLDRSAVV